MRTFRHLTRDEIADIIACHTGGETQASLALRFEVDHSTINYHVKRYRQAYPEGGGIYAAIKTQARKICIHPSGRCTLCGEMWDELRRQERDIIERLTKALSTANSRLRSAGFPVESVSYT